MKTKIKTKTTDWKILKWVAERSPKEYAATIFERNMVLLGKLNELYQGYKKGWKDSHNFTVDIECPHCNKGFNCFSEECLWSLALSSKKSFVCCSVKFRGKNYHEVSDYDCIDSSNCFFFISYSHANAGISFRCPGPDSSFKKKDIDREYHACKDFLKGHIEWAKKPYWGTKYTEEEL